jgi:uncharacterized protein (DUF1778 family)
MTTDGADDRITIRIGRLKLERIDHAARVTGMTRSAFLLAAALEKADAAILDRAHFDWGEAAVAAFRAALAEPPAPAPRAVEAIGRLPWKAG